MAVEQKRNYSSKVRVNRNGTELGRWEGGGRGQRSVPVARVKVADARQVASRHADDDVAAVHRVEIGPWNVLELGIDRLGLGLGRRRRRRRGRRRRHLPRKKEVRSQICSQFGCHIFHEKRVLFVIGISSAF